MSLLAHYYPQVDLRDTDEGQLGGYLQNVEKLERFKSQQLAQMIAKLLGGK